ncbi:hypothetical protein J2P12_00060 [Candidatus Bathyarchaeota archaeon]|nr:hypothetical protein [Candidatus Bathyarchaeota archaeon]
MKQDEWEDSMCGLLVDFSDLAIAKQWGSMETELKRNFQKMIQEAEEYQRNLERLSVKARDKFLRQMENPYVDPKYLPWGGLFPRKDDDD